MRGPYFFERIWINIDCSLEREKKNRKIMGKFFPVAAWGMMTAAKSCDSCKSAAAVLFCRTDSAFLCVRCDSRHHHQISPSSTAARQVKHERVWMCEVCEQAPASFTCRADAAALCVTCDRDIHSANPLASRHERLPVTAFYETAESVLLKSSVAATFNSGESQPDPLLKICPDALFCDNDQYLDFDSYGDLSLQNCGSDSVVPVQHQIKTTIPSPAMINLPGPADHYFEIDFSNPHSHSVSTSSMDGGVVPEGSSMSEISYPLGKIIGSGCDLDGSINPVPAQGNDRQARVLRYREKRKNRRFEKTIRYASRKAYAETRPRIKGRFAKRTDVDSDEMDPIFTSGSSTCFMGGYGVVPSF